MSTLRSEASVTLRTITKLLIGTRRCWWIRARQRDADSMVYNAINANATLPSNSGASCQLQLCVDDWTLLYNVIKAMEIVFVSESKVVMRGQPLRAPMDEWTGCREPAYVAQCIHVKPVYRTQREKCTLCSIHSSSVWQNKAYHALSNCECKTQCAWSTLYPTQISSNTNVYLSRDIWT